MRKLSGILIVLVLAVVAFFGFTPAVFAADTGVTFVDHSTKFVFLGASKYTATDLFDNFKDVMPGDNLRQQVIVTNDDPDGLPGKIYLHVRLHDESDNPLSPGVAATGETIASMTDFLDQLHLVVRNGDSVIFDGAPSVTDGLSSPVLLGTLTKGQQLTLTAELYVPITLGNEYAYRVGEVDWVFQLEEFDHPNPDPNPHPTPVTGDQTRKIAIGLVVLLVICAAVAIVACRAMRKNRKK